MKYPLVSKVFAIGMVAAILGLVMLRIDGLVGERRMRQQQAMQGVEQSLSGPQMLMGPILHRACVEQWETAVGEGKERTVANNRRPFTLMAVPRTLQVQSEAKSDVRHRGLFKVNTYAGPMTLEARWDDFSALQPVREHPGSRLECGPALAMLSVSDVRGLRSARAQVAGVPTPVRPGTGLPRYARGVHAEVPAARIAETAEPLTARFALDLAGTSSLSLVPAASQTDWSVKSDWPHPSFGGRFLPARREVAASGFSAHWTVSELASTAAAAVQRDGELCEPRLAASTEDDEANSGAPNAKCLETLRVSFIDPVNPYVLTDRATKYALLFIALTFTCVALAEILGRKRVHPVQYTLVGMALALFYLMLLSLSEHVAFGLAYFAASAGCVLLLGFYAGHMLKSRWAGAAFGTGVGALYGFLWVLLSLEQAALMVGSLLLFGVLAAVMVLTRRVDWYALVEGWRAEQPRPAAVQA
ncbi:cell envelope integrity protein CreD [Caenimonas aquaedulcis]|uniref:Cell envelope integrity protein CreD n=1 Tax=Caenimonas aquaedulcis TaxID=2793270 RepID=A0A931MI20_9BURK|nr:cell envelope integrity protein CreD [Caenimonas aquaedulcis]MBG9389374.1 cell envelope integrity protein CreD [Caenimonas aquaedulcis]